MRKKKCVLLVFLPINSHLALNFSVRIKIKSLEYYVSLRDNLLSVRLLRSVNVDCLKNLTLEPLLHGKLALPGGNKSGNDPSFLDS